MSCFADGSALGGQSEHWWALCVVLRDGKAITARGTTRSGRPSPKTLAKITQTAERYQIPAELTGAVLSRGLYADPGGQRGARYWSGRDWSPLLPANLANGKPLPEFPARVPRPLPEPYGTWRYAASQAKRFTVRAAVYAAAAVLLLAAALIVDRWDHGKLHEHVGLFGWLVLAGLCAFWGLSAWLRRKGYRKLDQAARGAPVAVRHAPPWVRQVGWALVPIVSFTVLAWGRFWSSRSSADGPATGLYLRPTWSRWLRREFCSHLAQRGYSPQRETRGTSWGKFFFALVLLVAVTAAVYTLVAFRPGVKLPSLSDAEQARANAKRQQPVMDAGGLDGTVVPETPGIRKRASSRGAVFFATLFAVFGLVFARIAMSVYLTQGRLIPVRAYAASWRCHLPVINWATGETRCDATVVFATVSGQPITATLPDVFRSVDAAKPGFIKVRYDSKDPALLNKLDSFMPFGTYVFLLVLSGLLMLPILIVAGMSPSHRRASAT